MTSPQPSSPRDRPTEGHLSGAELTQPAIDPQFGIAVLPAIVFWVIRRAGHVELAIGAGFVTSIIVFARTRQRGAIGALAVISIFVAGGAAIAGIIVESERVYLANDPVGDAISVAIGLGSLALRRPMFGLIATELSPRVRGRIALDHRVFYVTTWLWVAINAAQAVLRVIMLQELSIGEYLIWTRVISWPANAALIWITWTLVTRAIEREARLSEAATAG
jgi:hypothetical protein